MLLSDCGVLAPGRVDADAFPASERPSPAAPNAGKAMAFVSRFRFEDRFVRDMSHLHSSVQLALFKSYVWLKRHAMCNAFTNIAFSSRLAVQKRRADPS